MCALLQGSICLLLDLAKFHTLAGFSSALAGSSIFLKVLIPPHAVAKRLWPHNGQLMWGMAPVLACMVVPCQNSLPIPICCGLFKFSHPISPPPGGPFCPPPCPKALGLIGPRKKEKKTGFDDVS